MKIDLKKNYNYLFDNFTNIIWNIEVDKQKFSPINYRIFRWIRNTYLILVAITCLISLLTLFKPIDSIAFVWNIIISILQIFSFFFFVFDYVSHFITYQNFLAKQGKKYKSYKMVLKYIFSFFGILLFLCILSSIHVISNIGAISHDAQRVFDTMKILNLARVVRFFAVLTIFAPFRTIFGVFKKQRKVLINVLLISLFLIVIFALIIWNAEVQHLEDTKAEFLSQNNIQNTWISIYQNFIKEQFVTEEAKTQWLQANKVTQANMDLVASKIDAYEGLSSGYITTFFDAVYFATITLTTIGYGDLLPHATMSRIIVTINSLLALAIIAIPSGVIASEFLSATQDRITTKKKEKENNEGK
ncbi:potassium channel family protein [Mycoplasmopsis edwardii]|uniref:Potassium channel family protein n=3 Tax=Mycoplasmopsis edwardii TaxID=53558 RepID=A0ACD4PK56_9BACT|nr:potassium channel family protein [Mycoplasmopsis edwardii]WBP84221.1 potassium channel family protein [Mycoplasmopsis edwardii]